MISKKKWGITIDIVNVCVCVQVEPIIIKYCKNSKIQSFSSSGRSISKSFHLSSSRHGCISSIVDIEQFRAQTIQKLLIFSIDTACIIRIRS